MELTPKPKRTKYVTVALTPDEKVTLKAAAKRHKLTMSEFLRQLAENFLSSDFNSVEDFQSKENSEPEKELA